MKPEGAGARAPLPDMGAVLAGSRHPAEKEIRRRELPEGVQRP